MSEHRAVAQLRSVAAGVALAMLAPVGIGQAQPAMQFRTHQIIDQQQGGLVLGTVTVPEQWRVNAMVQWRYGDVSLPVRAALRAESPDGSAWVEFFPRELFYWLEPDRSPVAVGVRTLGMIHAPNITARDAMQHFLLGQHRGRMSSFQVVGSRQVDAGRLLAAFGAPSAAGEAYSYRVRYLVNGRPVDEEIFGLLTARNRIPYSGPQGTWYESHRGLILGHAIGATEGRLESAYPLLTFIATSVKIDPAWEAHRAQVEQQIGREFNRLIAQGYAQIQAAAQLSKTISANNDAMLGAMQAQRQAQAQREAGRRAAASTAQSPNDAFSQYLRGTERMKDPYRGESDQSYHQKYHWTDGGGNYRSSNDSTFNPNIGAGGGVNWQRMEPAR